MFTIFKKVFLACTMLLVVLTSGAWQNNQVVLAQGQNLSAAPLYPGLAWKSLGSSTRAIRVNVRGDSISPTGAAYQAVEKLTVPLVPDLIKYYSNAELAKSGWESYDSFAGSDGVHYVFYQASGIYLSIEFLHCS